MEEEKPSNVIELSERRPTPKELPAFAPPAVPAVDPRRDEFWSLMEPFFDGLQMLQAQLLSRLIPLALPELKRFPLSPLREHVRKPFGLPEEELRELELRLGSHPARVRKAKWLDARGYTIGCDPVLRGVETARPGETGVILGRDLFLLEDGRLGLVQVVGTWVWKMGLSHYDTLTTVGDAALIEPERAVKEFPFPSLLASLQGLLWFDRASSPAAPELEARRNRFMALVKELSKATAAYNERLRRVGLEPR
jgi:hypothetical protein